MKVYHGLPKSVTDEHTIFYASFDGTCNPKIGSMLKGANNLYYKPSPTGLAQYYTTSSAEIIKYKLNETLSIYTGFTIDFWINISEFRNVANMTYPEVMTFENADGSRSMKIYVSGTNKHIYIEINNSTWYDGVAITPKFDTLPDNCHIRLTSDGTSFKTYCNGVNVSTYAVKTSNNHRSFESVTLHPYRLYSDLCISNIDRGDYFPNLPQDFIEGKAIIRPKFGQQQIKGDPMYSQVTLDKVKIGTNVNEPQITCSRTSGEWASADTIKVKGLNGEIISGVIDTDTALARVTSNTPSTITLDSVGGLQVGDYFRLYNPNEKTFASSDRTITDINTETKTITFSGASLNTDNFVQGWLLVENTASSSSPTVKTADGTTVVGTWSGLGTNEATFTLGTNTSLAGKDLYIEYALTMPYGNSDFPELPYSIEKAWGENGVEMKPVNSLLIVDDFKYKISGSTKECPHICKSRKNSSLFSSNFANEGEELNSIDYGRISKLNDSPLNYVTTTVSGQISQQLFSFNIIEMVERKLGCKIPSANKVSWLKENLDSKADFKAWGYGIGATGNKFYVKMWNSTNNNFDGNPYHTSSTTSKLEFNTAVFTADRLTPDGFVHFLIHTDASNGTTESSVFIDYVSLDIKLKIDSTYATLYCENTRAREDQCNPILIQKETKTVKRYLPSKECFTTECKYVDSGAKSSREGYIDISKTLTNPKGFITSQGTGAYFLGDTASVSNGSRVYAQVLSKMFKNSNLYNPYEFTNEEVDNTGTRYGASLPENSKYVGELLNYVTTYHDVLIPESTRILASNFNFVYYWIYTKDGELKLHCSVHSFKNGKRVNSGGLRDFTIPLANRPLIK